MTDGEAMTDIEIPTQPIPAAIDTARRALYRILNGEPEDVVDDLAVIEALAILEDVRPPYPPPPPDDVAWTLDEGLPVARAALAEAVETSRYVQEALRVALASRELPTAAPLGEP